MEELTYSLLKLLVIFVVSFIFGFNRQRLHKHVGFGAFIFVSLGSCVLGILSLRYGQNQTALIAAVVTGIGFLGAGALIKGNDKVFGFTTAASIWLYAIFGILVGINEFLMATFVYIVVWIVILTDLFLERKGIGSYQRKIKIVVEGINNYDNVLKDMTSNTKKFKLISLDVDKKKKETVIKYMVEGSGEKIRKMIAEIIKEKNVKSCG